MGKSEVRDLVLATLGDRLSVLDVELVPGHRQVADAAAAVLALPQDDDEAARQRRDTGAAAFGGPEGFFRFAAFAAPGGPAAEPCAGEPAAWFIAIAPAAVKQQSGIGLRHGVGECTAPR